MLSHSIKNVLGCGLAILLLSSCSGTPVKEIKISSKAVEKPQLTLPPVDVVRMRKVDWTIITEKNFEEVVANAKKEGTTVAFFALTDDGYANLGLNFSDIRALVQQQKSIILAYEKYYKNVEEFEKIKQEVKPKSTLDKFNPFK